MGRGLIVVLIAGFMTFTCGSLGPVSTDAQEGTPQVGMIGVEIASGVTFELVPSSEDPPSLYRLRLAPGATLSFVGDPAISLVYVESGELTLQMDAEVSDARPDVPGEDEQDADPALTVNLGDYFVLPPQVAGEMRNESQRTVSIVIAAITPGMIPSSAIATPVPE
ncbi:MAG TPA: hypothetical protein VK356_00950 [Thermomicrobiales bacterium]|nr:hypothetical protein [Thermomicrobiales bacterium]